MPKLTDSSIKAAACPADKHRYGAVRHRLPRSHPASNESGLKELLFKILVSPALEIRVAHVGVLSGSRLGRRARQIADHRKLIAKDKDPRAEQRQRTPALRPFRGTHVQPALRQNTSRVRKGPRRGGKPEQELLEKRCGLPEEAPPALGASACQLDHT